VRSKACTVVTLGSWVGIPLGDVCIVCICVVVVVVVVIVADAVSRGRVKDGIQKPETGGRAPR
jgi:hypothetical protein